MESWSDGPASDASDVADGAVNGDGGAVGTDASSSKYAAAVLKDGPIGYWRLDETNGTVARDLSGNGYDGTYGSAGFSLAAPGAIAGDGTGVSVSNSPGTDGVVNIGTTNRFAFTGTAPFSIEAWVKVSINDDGYRSILKRSRGGPRDGFNVWAHGGGVGFERTTNDVNVAIIVPIPLDTFVHVVCTYDVDIARLYTNGVLGKSTPMKTPIVDTGEPLVWGYSSKPSEFFAGTLDEPAIYDKALTASQVLAHYNAAK